MVETSATIRLQAVDAGLVSTINDISNNVTNAQVATTGLNFAFKGLSKAATTGTGQLALGARKADLVAESFGKAAGATGKLVKAIAPIGNSIFLIQQTAIAAEGLFKAYQKIIRVPQALQAVEASGISTRIIQDFANLNEAIKGNDVALDNFVNSAIASLGKFEAAAARAGTILRSSVRFDESGNFLRANEQERLENALNIQKLVNDELKNSVTSTKALNGQYEVLSSGFTKTAQSQRVLTSGLKLVGIAEAGGMAADTAQTLQLLTKTLNAYELSSEDAANTAGVLNAIVENGLTTIQQLSLGFGATSKQAKQANIDLIDLGASVSVLTSQGVSTPEALTGISRVSANIIDKTPEAEKALAKLQLRGEKIRFDKAEIQAKGFTKALIDLNEAAGGSPEILAQIFPEDVAFRTVNALLAERGKRLADIRGEITKATGGSLDEVFEIATSNRTKRFQRLINRAQETIIKFGLEIVPVLEPGIKALESIANQFERFPEPVKQAIGQLIKLRIQTKAYGGAAKILINTLVSLAGNYLLVRTVSLALTGQLGQEINTIKQLIQQRKGLAAVTLQLFGISQKWQLAEIATTEALAKQSKLQNAVAFARSKAVDAGKSVATTVAAVTTQTSRQAVVAGFKETKDNAIAVAKEVADRGKEIGSALVDKVKEQINNFPRAVEAPLTPQPITAPIPKPPTTPPPLTITPVAPPIAAPAPQFTGAPVVPVTATPQQFTGIPIAPPIAAPAPQFTGAPVVPPSSSLPTPQKAPPGLITLASTLDVLVSKDTEVAEKLSKQVKLEEELLEVESKRNNLANKTQKLKEARDKAELKVTEAKTKAIELNNSANATAEARQKALLEVQKRQERVARIKQKIDETQFEYIKTNTDALVAQNRVTEAVTKTEAARTAAQQKYKPLAIALRETEKAKAQAIALSQRATIANYKAEQIAISTGKNSKAAIQALAVAKDLEARATEAQTAAKNKDAVVTELTNKLLRERRLAEQGLYEVKIFGSKQTLAETGVIGAINKLLTRNIDLTKLRILTEKALNKVLTTGKNILDIRNARLLKENVLLAAKDVKSFATSVFKLGQSGFDKAGAGINILTKSLGVLTPLLAIAGLSVVAFRDELFGLGAASRKLAKDYQLAVAEQEKLANTLGKRVGIAKVNRALASEDLQQTEREITLLREQGFITTDQYNNLANTLKKVGDKKEDIKALRQEINKLGIEGEKIESGVFDKIGGAIGGTFSAIGKGFTTTVDNIANIGASIVGNVAQLGTAPFTGQKIEFISNTEIAEARQYDALIKPLSTLSALQKSIGDNTIVTTRALVKYRTQLALTSEIAEKISKGFRLTEVDFKLEEQRLNAIIKQNAQEISDANKTIEQAEKDLEKAKTEAQKNAISRSIDSARSTKENLETKNQELRELQSQIKKYLKDELPAIRTALKEQAQPELLLANARANFSNAFIDENQLILKPLEILRDDALKLISAIEDSLSLGILDREGLAGEKVAAQELRRVRDEQIEFMEDGELRRGYRLTLAQRRDLSSLIANIENTDLKRREQARQLEINQIKELGKLQVNSDIETNKQLAKLQLESIENNIAQKEKELKEAKELGVRTIEQEAELDKLRYSRKNAALKVELSQLQKEDERRAASLRSLEIERIRQLGEQRLLSTTEVNQRLAQLEIEAANEAIAQKEREIAKRREKGIVAVDSDIELEQLRLRRQKAIYRAQITELENRFAQIELIRKQEELLLQRTIFDSQQQIVGLEQEKVLNNELLNSYNRQSQVLNNIFNLQKQISQNTVFNAQQQEKLAQFQIKQLQSVFPLQNKQFDIESSITKEQNKQNLLQAQQQKNKSELALLRLQEQRRLAISNEADKEVLNRLDLEIETQQLQLDQAESNIKQAEFRLEIEDDLIKNKEQQLKFTQQEQILNSQINLSVAQRAIAETEINRTYTSRNSAIASQLQFLQLEKKTLTDKANFRTQELNLASELTNSEVKKQRLARNIANIKLRSLTSQLKLEAEILAYNQQQEQIQLRRDKSLNQAAQQQNLADILSAQAQVKEVTARGGTPEQIAAAQATLEAQFAQRQALQFESQQLRQRDRLLEAQQQQAIEAFERQSQLQLTQARVESLQYLPEGQRDRLSRQIYNDLVRGADINLPNLSRTIDNLAKLDIDSPTLTIPEIKFPDIEDIKQDVKAIVAEFKVEKADSRGQTAEGKQINISTLQLEAPITITVTGDDAGEIAEKVESRVFQGLANTIKNLELD